MPIMTYENMLAPSLVLGFMIALPGRYISKITPGNPLVSPLILILACGIGWFLAFVKPLPR